MDEAAARSGSTEGAALALLGGTTEADALGAGSADGVPEGAGPVSLGAGATSRGNGAGSSSSSAVAVRGDASAKGAGGADLGGVTTYTARPDTAMQRAAINARRSSVMRIASSGGSPAVAHALGFAQPLLEADALPHEEAQEEDHGNHGQQHRTEDQ